MGPAEGRAAGDVHPRVRRARALHAALRRGAFELSQMIAQDAEIAVDGARANLTIGDDSLSLGPGLLGVERSEQDFVVDLAPSLVDEQATGARALTFKVRVPLADEKAPVVAELRGGPVWLSTLGVNDGDLGLRDTARTSLESDATVTLPADGQALHIDGSGKLHKLSIADARLAPSPLEGVELAWRFKGDATLDGSHIHIDESEFDLGDIRLLLRGDYWRKVARAEGQRTQHRVAVDFELPIVTCQDAFSSLPKAIVPLLDGMRFRGAIAAKGHARFDTEDLKRSYDVDWAGTLGCRVTDVPVAIDAKRFSKAFVKVVYTPKMEERNMTFGPESGNWVALNSIARHMQGSVLTTEDGRFFRHSGFDQEAIVNSMRMNIEARRFVRGASTISMQLAKNLYLKRTKTLSRKLQEAILTMYLEQVLTKREMMELYLNIIEYGPMVYGIGPAASHYFNTTPGQLSLGQTLYLASILSSPQKQYFGAGGAVSPRHMAYLRKLMKIVRKINWISDEELEEGLRETVIFGSPVPHRAAPEPADIYADDTPATG